MYQLPASRVTTFTPSLRKAELSAFTAAVPNAFTAIPTPIKSPTLKGEYSALPVAKDLNVEEVA
jgi:hypothetical protein